MIEIINIAQQKLNEIRVMICQFNSKEFDWENKFGLSFIVNNEKISTKVMGLLKIAKQNSTDFVIFPELSIPEKLIEKIRIWSQEHNAIVVCGSHYIEKSKTIISRCPVIIDGAIFYTEKINPSPLEKSPIMGEGLKAGSKILKFANTKFGNIGLLICADYLDEKLKQDLSLDDLDILCIPSFQRQSEVYYRLMNYDCENSKNGIYILYSNFYDEKYGDGNSAIFGVMDNLFTQKLKEKNYTDLVPDKKIFQFTKETEFAIFDIDLKNKRPFVNRNITTSPNIHFIAKNNFQSNIINTFLQKIAHDDERYKNIDDYYVPPKEFKEILLSLENNNMVFIIGDPGIGKTYTAVKLLKIYFEKGYEPIWFSGLEKEERAVQSKVLNDFIPQNNQIVYFEDPFGRTVFERRDSLLQVFSPLMEKLLQLNSKVVITSRKEVFEKFSEESLLEKEVLNLKKEMNIRSPSYNSDELKEIFDKLACIHCEWYQNYEYKEIVYNAIQKKKLNTPLAIREIVFMSRSINKIQELKDKIEKRKFELIKVFAIEIHYLSNATKALLYTILFSGNKGHHFLSELFSSILQELVEMKFDIIIFPFNLEVRSQLGYRIEQFGNIKTAYKFTHPIYEEALASLILHDKTSELIVKQIIKEISKIDPKLAYIAINKIVVKYPEVSILLFKNLRESNVKLLDIELKLTLSQKLIATFFITQVEEYFVLAESFYSLKECVDSLNESKDENYILSKLNLIKRYIKNSPLTFDHTYSLKIKWENVFKREFFEFKHPNKLIYLLILANSISNTSIKKFVEIYPDNSINRIFFLSDFMSREQFFKLLNGYPIQEELKKYRENINFHERNTNPFRLYKNIILSDLKYYGKIFIDDGAEKSLRKKWTNLLPIGITNVIGVFFPGEKVGVFNSKGNIIAIGFIEYSSDDLLKIKGHHTVDYIELIGFFATSNAIRRKNIYWFTNELKEKWNFEERIIKD